MSCHKKNSNSNQLESFGKLDFQSDTIFSSNPKKKPRLNQLSVIPKKNRCRQPPRNKNSDTSGFDLGFERKINDFTNPKANPKNRARCVPQDFEFVKSDFIRDYEATQRANCPTDKFCDSCRISNTGGIKPQCCHSSKFL